MNIDKLYYINLSKRPDRNEHFLNECKKANIQTDKIERYDAMNGDTYPFDKEDLKMFQSVDYRGRRFEKRIIGNQLSHYYILKEMVAKQYNHILICQDDIVFKNDFIMHFNRVMKNLPENAEIVNIGFHKSASLEKSFPFDLSCADNFNDLGHSKVNEYVCYLKHHINPCSTAYIVTRNGAIQLLDYFEKTGFLRATDGNYNDYLRNKNIFYGSTAVLCTGNPALGSDIFSNF